MSIPGFEAAVFADPAFERLVAILRSFDECVVAYSGGVDSAFLLKVAHSVLGEKCLGVLAFSESLDRSEFEEARKTAEAARMPIEVVETREYDNPEYRKNDATRCYHCKTELFEVVKRFAAARGIRHVLDGSNRDDVGDFRPGLRARDEQGVRSPLLEAGLGKTAIRAFSRALGLPTWDKPAAPCLSSRIPYGSPIEFAKLRQVEAAEGALRALGFRALRVRHHDAVARIEVPLDELQRFFTDPDLRACAVEGVQRAGFLHVALDLEGLRSGSLNAALDPSARARATQGRAGSSPDIPIAEVGRLSRPT